MLNISLKFLNNYISPNDLMKPTNKLVLLNKNRNLLDKFEKYSIYEFNPSF